MKLWPFRRPVEAPVVRLKYREPISEFEAERLDKHGVWIKVEVQVTENGQWCNWKHEIPEELRKETRDALAALCLHLQD